MSETPAASAAEPGVVASSFDAGETFSKQYVDDLKAKLEAKTAETATLNAKFSAHQDRQRAALKGMQSEVEGFVEDAYNMAPEEVKHEIDPMRQFAKSLGENANPESAMPLARVICLSSGKFKRERSEFSKSAEMAEQLAAANKKIDELTSDRDGKVSRISELELLADERQAGLEKLQGVLAEKGMLQDKFDFSKASSREANASTDAPAAPSAPLTLPITSSVSCAARLCSMSASPLVISALVSPWIAGCIITSGSQLLLKSLKPATKGFQLKSINCPARSQ